MDAKLLDCSDLAMLTAVAKQSFTSDVIKDTASHSMAGQAAGFWNDDDPVSTLRDFFPSKDIDLHAGLLTQPHRVLLDIDRSCTPMSL